MYGLPSKERMKKLLLLLVSVVAFAQSPDCILFFNFDSAGVTANRDVRQLGCVNWSIGYQSSGFSALTLTFQSASGAVTPGTFAAFSGTTASGSNPMTDTTGTYSTFTGYVGWVNVKLSAVTGTGNLIGVLYGYKSGYAGAGAVTGPGITILSGDATTPAGGGPQPLTFKTVNSNVGACGDSTHYCVPTLNAKGLATAATTFALPAVTAQLHTIVLSASNGGSVLNTGDLKVYGTADFSCTINRVDISADQSGSITVDIWKRSAAIPSSGNKISASAPVTLSSAQLAQSGSLTGWTTAVSTNDVFGASIQTVATVTAITIQIWCQ
jgi:hypothetical protein